MRRIPLAEVIAECMKKPGFAQAREQARRELEEEIAIYGTIANPKHPQPARTSSRIALFAKKSRVHSRRRITVRSAAEA